MPANRWVRSHLSDSGRSARVRTLAVIEFSMSPLPDDAQCVASLYGASRVPVECDARAMRLRDAAAESTQTHAVYHGSGRIARRLHRAFRMEEIGRWPACRRE